MRRREFLALPGAAALGRLVPAFAQTTKPVVGFLSSRSPDESRHLVAAFQKGLSEIGFTEPANLSVEYRWANGRYDDLPALANELVGLGVTAIFTAGGPPSAVAAKAATTTIPIVFSAANDPVRLGLVTSLAHPGGNVTGMSTLTTGLATKAIELIHEIVPQTEAVAFMMNPSNPTARLVIDEANSAAQSARLNINILRATNVEELAASLGSLRGLKTALVIYADPFFDSRREQIVGLAAEYGVPAIYPWRDYAVSGGLISYGSSLSDSYRRAAMYLGRILKGEKPADLPVEQPSKFDLVINLKTAGTLGITIPPIVLARADEVID